MEDRDALSGYSAPTVDAAEVAKFSALSEQWHDPNGAFKPLHVFNPCRLEYIKDMAAKHFTVPKGLNALQGLRIADIGCGGGLISAPLARMGADVIAIDASEKNIGVARHYASQHGLNIDYRATDSGTLAAQSPASCDMALCLEVIEHVADPQQLIHDLYALVKPGGLVILATINRTKTSFIKAIIGAEYVLRWLPRGTHDWRKFVTPYEMTAMGERAGLMTEDISGFSFSLLSQTWTRGRDVSVNYALTAVKPGA